MAKLRADKRNYKKAFTVHANSYDNWNIGSPYSRRLLLCYCVECGLKCLIMENDNCKLCSNGMPVPLLRNGYSIFNGTKYR